MTGEVVLDEVEIRVLGCLVEKEKTTPDYYPLTRNALLSACNQKSSRDPVVSYNEQTVVASLESLRERGLVHLITTSDGRVPRYRHVFSEALQLSRPQNAALCLLMLRGPQTIGEIRQRSARLYDFASLEEVEDTLKELASRPVQPLVVKLARQAGTKEPRYAQLLSGPAGEAAQPEPAPQEPAPGDREQLQLLEAEVEKLRGQVEQLRAQFEIFQKQFE